VAAFLEAVDSRRGVADERFCNGGHANGGYLVALLADAASQRADTVEPEPVAVDAVFLAGVRPGPIGIDVHSLRTGRATSVFGVSLRQSDRTAVSGHVVIGQLPRNEPIWSSGKPADVPNPDACTQAAAGLAAVAPYLDHVDVRLDPSSAGLLSGHPSGLPEIRGWMRLPDLPSVHPSFLIVAPDLFFPTVWQLGSYVAPATMTMSWQGRSHPTHAAGGWVWVEVTTTRVDESWCDETAACYDSTGRLLATARQMARMPRGASAA